MFMSFLTQELSDKNTARQYQRTINTIKLLPHDNNIVFNHMYQSLRTQIKTEFFNATHCKSMLLRVLASKYKEVQK